MKKTIIYSFAAIALAACSSNEKTARSKVEEHIQANAHDPKSYEFISIEKPDTVTVSDTLETSAYLDSFIDLDIGISSLNRAKENVADYEDKIQGEYGYIYKEGYDLYVDQVKEYTLEIEKAKKQIEGKKKRIADLKKNPAEDHIVRIIYTVNFRLKNGLGALRKSSATIIYVPKGDKWEEVRITKS